MILAAWNISEEGEGLLEVLREASYCVTWPVDAKVESSSQVKVMLEMESAVFIFCF